MKWLKNPVNRERQRRENVMTTLRVGIGRTTHKRLREPTENDRNSQVLAFSRRFRRKCRVLIGNDDHVK